MLTILERKQILKGTRQRTSSRNAQVVVLLRRERVQGQHLKCFGYASRRQRDVQATNAPREELHDAREGSAASYNAILTVLEFTFAEGRWKEGHRALEEGIQRGGCSLR